ncbi:hypothetical protein [Antarcticirhabdus aurantiaca]|uniref:Uncharacterized protein n=1 Tax=Antarcticirhabdus aurantiaca TaxID=2606717 RepID=A0ACD4NN21_9HYPH|nr:hypothetical protein [Antarcticirhabdus aurantiaca]WAJ28021.1 hypothetical protein OXU80_24870 [Jeongeuplla avenae]
MRKANEVSRDEEDKRRLIALAKVEPAKQNEALQDLALAIPRAKQAFEAAKAQRLAPVQHDPALTDVQVSAKNLVNALRRLQSAPLAHALFWERQPDGPAYENAERENLFKVLGNIHTAAERAKNNYKRGGLPDRAKDRVIDYALGAYRRNSPLPYRKTSSDLLSFVEAFFEVVTGESAGQAGITRSLNRVWRRRHPKT